MPLKADSPDQIKDAELPAVLKSGRTVEAWCIAPREAYGVRITVRELKRRAQERELYTICGKQALLLPEHLDAHLQK